MKNAGDQKVAHFLCFQTNLRLRFGFPITMHGVKKIIVTKFACCLFSSFLVSSCCSFAQKVIILSHCSVFLYDMCLRITSDFLDQVTVSFVHHL